MEMFAYIEVFYTSDADTQHSVNQSGRIRTTRCGVGRDAVAVDARGRPRRLKNHEIGLTQRILSKSEITMATRGRRTGGPQ
jgi:hypothetical protein